MADDIPDAPDKALLSQRLCVVVDAEHRNNLPDLVQRLSVLGLTDIHALSPMGTIVGKGDNRLLERIKSEPFVRSAFADSPVKMMGKHFDPSDRKL